MNLNKLHKDSELLRIYELFNNSYEKYGQQQDYFSLHALDRLFSDFDKSQSKESKEIKKIVKPFLSDFTIYPYLMLENLTDAKAEEITGLIFNDISKNLFQSYKFEKQNDVIRRVEYPSLEQNFIKNLLSKITSERRNEKFNDPKKARELFLYYADKNHIGMMLDQLELYSRLYHREADDGGGLDCSDE